MFPLTSLLNTWLDQIGGTLLFTLVWFWASWLNRRPIAFEIMVESYAVSLLMGCSDDDKCVLRVRFTLPAAVLPADWQLRVRWFATDRPQFIRLP